MHRFSDVLDFYNILYRIVKGWPATFPNATGQEVRSKRLNTFAVIRTLADFDADNLKKTVGYTSKDFFFSRVWHDSQYQSNALRTEYPALGVREDTFQLNDPLDISSGRRHTFHNLTLLIADQLPYKENVTLDPVSSARTIEEVGNDLRLRMAELLLLMGKFIYAQGYLAAVLQFEGWYSKDHLDDLVTAGTIDNYILQDTLVSYVTNVTPSQGEVFYNIGGDNLVVCIISLRVETGSCPTLPVVVFEDPTVSQTNSEIFEGDAQSA